MKLISPGYREWVGKRVVCPECGAVYELELSDAGKHPKRTEGKWGVREQCPECRKVGLLSEVGDASG